MIENNFHEMYIVELFLFNIYIVIVKYSYRKNFNNIGQKIKRFIKILLFQKTTKPRVNFNLYIKCS